MKDKIIVKDLEYRKSFNLNNFKKKIKLVVILFALVLSLYISTNYDNLIFSKNFNLYAKEADASSISTAKPVTGDDMVELLARLINGEARGEPYIGQVAVGAVILNRVKSPKFPNTIAGVIYQNNQCSSVKDGQFDVAIEEGSTVYKAAQEAMNGSDPTGGALYFYNPSKTKSKWLFSLETTTTIGKHNFALGE